MLYLTSQLLQKLHRMFHLLHHHIQCYNLKHLLNLQYIHLPLLHYRKPQKAFLLHHQTHLHCMFQYYHQQNHLFHEGKQKQGRTFHYYLSLHHLHKRPLHHLLDLYFACPLLPLNPAKPYFEHLHHWPHLFHILHPHRQQTKNVNL